MPAPENTAVSRTDRTPERYRRTDGGKPMPTSHRVTRSDVARQATEDIIEAMRATALAAGRYMRRRDVIALVWAVACAE
jgi:hypothetical protein